jgi:hypothetical protein
LQPTQTISQDNSKYLQLPHKPHSPKLNHHILTTTQTTIMRPYLNILEALVCAFFLADAAVAVPTASWHHKLGQGLCTPTGPGVCNLGFSVKTFSYQEKDGFVIAPPAIYNITIYDRDCNILTSAATTETVNTPDSFTSETEPPRFDISTPIGEVNVSDYMRTENFLCDAGWPNGGCLAPVFEHDAKKTGGKKGCSCGNSGLEKGLKWACQCAFDC